LSDTPANHSEIAVNLLPDFCQGKTVLVLILVTELFVLTMVLASSGIRTFSWDYLALVSLFVQWIVLLSALLLCRLRFWLRRLPITQLVVAVYALILMVTLISTLTADWMLAGADFNSPFQVRGDRLLRNLLISAIMTGMLLRYLYVQTRLRRQEQAELASRIEALQSRIRPHFLFNSMNSIASLIATDPQLAERVVEDLAELFRASLKGADQPVAFSRELQLSKRYIGIEQLRLGERLRINWQIDKIPETATIPMLTLQPLLENAIYHGIQPLPEGGVINVLVQCRAQCLEITISNPCDEMQRGSPVAGNRIALDNIRSRLVAFYGEKAKLTTSVSQGVFVTQLSYPLVRS